MPSFAGDRNGVRSSIRHNESHSYPFRTFLCHSLFTNRPYVNVYLCIKQALFIRPMNMHCFVAVARCRVQTRRYHCLINHTQSHRTTLRTFVPLVPYPALITPRANSLRTRRVIPRVPLRIFYPRFLPSRLPHHPHDPASRAAAIDTNLRNFFGAPTCHRVTARVTSSARRA